MRAKGDLLRKFKWEKLGVSRVRLKRRNGGTGDKDKMKVKSRRVFGGHKGGVQLGEI